MPRAHAASPESRNAREIVWQRSCWVGMRTRIRNRIHRLLGRIPGGVELPHYSDLFGTKGTSAMRGLKLSKPQSDQLAQNLEMLAEVQKRIGYLEKQLEALCRRDKDMALLRSIPGLGKVLACVIGSEIDGIGRFETKARFIGYCGLAPTTHGSAGRFHHGRMITQCNRWLKWAFIEAAWVAIGCNGYFGAQFKRQQARGKNQPPPSPSSRAASPRSPGKSSNSNGLTKTAPTAKPKLSPPAPHEARLARRHELFMPDLRTLGQHGGAGI